MGFFEGYPVIFVVATVMWIIHGFILDIVVIGFLPFLNPKAADAERKDKFPWALGGYEGFPLVRTLAHRRHASLNNTCAPVRRSKTLGPHTVVL